MTRTATTWAILVITILAVVLGLYLSGGPIEGRKSRRDALRESDLRALSSLVECLARTQGNTLPETLAVTPECDTKLRLDDPFTHAPYVYTHQENALYRVCATFETRPGFWDGTVPFGRRDPETGCIAYEYRPL